MTSSKIKHSYDLITKPCWREVKSPTPYCSSLSPPSPPRETPRPRTHTVVEGRRRMRKTPRMDGKTGFFLLVESPSARSWKRGIPRSRALRSFVRRRAVEGSSRSWRRGSTKRPAGWPLPRPDAARALLPSQASSGLALVLLEGVHVATLLLTLLTLCWISDTDQHDTGVLWLLFCVLFLIPLFRLSGQKP